jgi:ubiquinone/menaquinone biosynthesis C-methylase UbiE
LTKAGEPSNNHGIGDGMNVDYSDISRTYDKYRSYHKGIMEKVIEFGEIKEGTKVLDLGCGTGNIASQLLEMAKMGIIGVDLSIPMLETAREKSLEVLCANVDSHRLPFCDNSFDLVIGAYVVHQIKNLEFLFSECYRVLQVGMLVLLTSSHEQIESQHPVMKQFFPSFIDIDKDRFPDIPRIDYLLNSAGFRDIKHQEVVVENIPMDEEYLHKVKNRYVSTYYLLPQREFELGVEGLEAFIKNRSRLEFREWRGTLVQGRKHVE